MSDTLELTAYNDFLIDAAMLSMNESDTHDLTPTMLVEDAEGRMTIVLLPGEMDPFDMFTTVLPLQREQLKPVRLSFSADTFTSKVPGGLAERFEAGDETVSEAVQILVVTADDTLSTVVKYTRTDEGLVWQRPETKVGPDGPQVARLADLLRTGLV